MYNTSLFNNLVAQLGPTNEICGSNQTDVYKWAIGQLDTQCTFVPEEELCLKFLYNQTHNLVVIEECL